jgi:predicted TIM-barrel fold metal-dependent hydrolase
MGVDQWIVGEIPGIVEEFENVYLETSGSADSPRGVVANPVARLGAGRVLFGSDAPGLDPRLAILKIRLAALSASDEAAVLGGNIARLLKLSPVEVSSPPDR